MTRISSLIGIPSKLTILDDSGRVIVREGEIITPGVIRRATDAGRLPELEMAAALLNAPMDIRPASEYEEIGEEEPTGTHPD